MEIVLKGIEEVDDIKIDKEVGYEVDDWKEIIESKIGEKNVVEEIEEEEKIGG